jgi:hypothetical protein
MSCTSQEVWAAIPYAARSALAGHVSDVDRWTNERIQVTPWCLLPLWIKEMIHAETTCEEMESAS